MKSVRFEFFQLHGYGRTAVLYSEPPQFYLLVWGGVMCLSLHECEVQNRFDWASCRCPSFLSQVTLIRVVFVCWEVLSWRLSPKLECLYFGGLGGQSVGVKVFAGNSGFWASRPQVREVQQLCPCDAVGERAARVAACGSSCGVAMFLQPFLVTLT